MSPEQPRAVVVPPALLRRTVIAAALGNALEWYDFGVYNYLTAVVGRVFFPASDPVVRQLATLGAFVAASTMRPVGAAVFGLLGDRIGRKKVLSATMLMMAVGSFSIALIPPRATIGVFAPLLLLLARLVQGFSTGGEYGGAMTFIAEFAPHRRRGATAAWLEFGTCAGFAVAASLSAGLSGVLSPAALDGWGWRVPFLLAGPFGLIGLYIRTHLDETPAFRALPQGGGGRALRTIVTQWRAVVLCMALVVVFNIPDFIVLSYTPTYMTSTLRLPEGRALTLATSVVLLMMGLVPLAGWLSDRIGRRPMVLACSLGNLLVAVPCFRLIQTGGTGAILLGFAGLGTVLAGLIGAMPGTLAALFPTAIRYGALAVSYNLAISLFGGPSLPFTAWLVHATGDATAPAYVIMASALIGFVAAWRMPETAGQPLPGAMLSVSSEAEAREIGARPVAIDALADHAGAAPAA